MAEEKRDNTIIEIKEFFNTPPGPPLHSGEFVAFWKSCSEEDKRELMQADLKIPVSR